MAKSAISFKITGHKRLEANLRAIVARMPLQAAAALLAEAEEIMTVSKRDHVPVAPDGGTLRASGHVNTPEFDRGGISVTLGYGGPAAAYAEAIHEHPSGASPPSWGGTSKRSGGSAGVVLDFHLGGDRTKYLERPLLIAGKGMAARIAKDLNMRAK